MVSDPLTRYMFCSPGAGAAALVLCSPEAPRTMDGSPVALRSAASRTRRFGSFEVFSPWIPAGELTSVSREDSAAAFAGPGPGPRDGHAYQLQDTDSGADGMHMAECGFCEDGEQERLVASGATGVGGAL